MSFIFACLLPGQACQQCSLLQEQRMMKVLIASMALPSELPQGHKHAWRGR